MISNGDKYIDQPMHPGCQVDWCLPIVQNSSASMEVGSMLHMCHISVEQVDLDYPEMCCPLHLMWLSQTALRQWAYCLQVALGLGYLYSQPQLQVCHSQPALSWDWLVTNSSYVGSGGTPHHHWGIPHRLVHWGRATFPPHIPYFPTSSVSYGGPWRQLHGLGPRPQPPRWLPCFTYHSLVCGAVPLLPGMIWPSYGPFRLIPSVSVQTFRW